MPRTGQRDPVGVGLPSLPDGEPLLQRWFVIPMLVLAIAAIGVTIWMFATYLAKPEISVAERRPPGTAEVTHERGQAVLNDTRETAPGPACATNIELFGDEGARATVRAAMSAACQLLESGDFPRAQAGLARWLEADGQLRVAVFELTGVEASARVETSPETGSQRIVIELNPRFQFQDGFRAAPMIVHELVHLAGPWPGTAVSAEGELAAMQAQHRACEQLSFAEEPPRGCLDAALLADDPDAIEQLVAAGYRRAGSGTAPDGTEGTL